MLQTPRRPTAVFHRETCNELEWYFLLLKLSLRFYLSPFSHRVVMVSFYSRLIVQDSSKCSDTSIIYQFKSWDLSFKSPSDCWPQSYPMQLPRESSLEVLCSYCRHKCQFRGKILASYNLEETFWTSWYVTKLMAYSSLRVGLFLFQVEINVQYSSHHHVIHIVTIYLTILKHNRCSSQIQLLFKIIWPRLDGGEKKEGKGEPWEERQRKHKAI